MPTDPSTTSPTNAFVANASGYGASPEVNASTMKASNRVVTSVDMAVSMYQTDNLDARKLIIAARRITPKKQGAPPYNPAILKAQGKNNSKRIDIGQLA